MVEIKLHGILGEEIDPLWNLDILSVSEAMHAINTLSNQKFFSFLLEKDKEGIKYQLLINGRDFVTPEKITEKNCLETAPNSELAMKLPNMKTIDIIPVLEGADSGLINTIAGAVLIIIGIVLIATGYGAAAGVVLLGAGLALLASGIMALLSPKPKFEDFREIDGSTGRTSYLFNGPEQTVREGGPVPVLYGRLLVGSQVISASYKITNVDASFPYGVL